MVWWWQTILFVSALLLLLFLYFFSYLIPCSNEIINCFYYNSYTIHMFNLFSDVKKKAILIKNFLMPVFFTYFIITILRVWFIAVNSCCGRFYHMKNAETAGKINILITSIKITLVLYQQTKDEIRISPLRHS